MAALIHLDTHVVAWFAAGELDRFSPTARRLFESGELVVSPMVALELTYLHELGRLGRTADEILAHLQRHAGVTIADHRFAAVVEHAREQRWTRDPFDRLIVGHALAGGAPLLTADRRIRRHVPEAAW